jgi:VCBS repeat-containing protein
VNFAVAVTDVDGDRTAGGNLVIAINDDAPVAVADTDLVVAGQTVAESGNVLTGVGTTSGAADVLGADGAAGGGAVVGVVLGTSGNPVSGGVGAAIAGAFGTLTLNADGSYSYVHTGMAGGGTDSFTYTIKDADGSISTATLTIAVADSSPGGISIPGAGGADTQVFEAGLGPRGGEPAGSNSAAPTTAVGTITFTSVDGVKQIEVGGLVLTASGALKTFTDATGSLTASFSYDAATGQGTISYSYTLVDNTQGDPSSVSFAVAVTDQDGDRSQGGDLVISIVDDAPVAVADTDSVAAGQLVAETGNVLTGAGTTSGAADVLGADGASAGGAVVGVVLGPSGSPVSGGVWERPSPGRSAR